MRAIVHHGPITRVQIAKQAGISKQTVSEVVNKLEAEGWIHEAGRTSGAVGRTAISYRLNPASGYVMAVDLGGSKTRAAISNLAGGLLIEDERPSDPRGGEFVIVNIVQHCRELAERAGIDWSRVVQIAVGSPGVINSGTGMIGKAPNIPLFEGIEVEKELLAALSVPTILENDANLAVLGEQWQGCGKGCANFALIVIGTGVGMGLMLDGKIYRGARGAAGEVGYMPLGSDPFDPSMSRRGPLEEAIGGTGIMRRYKAIGGSSGQTVPEIFAAVENGEDAAVAVLDDTARLIALTIASVAAILDPERLVLGGRIGGRPELRAGVARWLAQIMSNPPPVETSLLGDRASLVGALAVALGRAHHTLFAARSSPEPLTLPDIGAEP